MAGLWERDEGTLLIWNRDDVMVGHIEFFRPVSYWDAYEFDGTARGAFCHGGRSVDVLIYSLLRDDPRPWHKSN